MSHQNTETLIHDGGTIAATVDPKALQEAIQAGVRSIDDKCYATDAKGALLPVETLKPQYLLEDQTVRQIMFFADNLSAQIARFRGHTMSDLGEFDALLGDIYGQTRGGQKGNRTYQTIDGCMKVQVQVADHIDFGPELQVAKGLIDECLNEWAEDANAELRAIVTRAFNTDKEGKINRSEIFMLLRVESEDERWRRAQDAIRDAMRVVGSKEYVRFYRRSKPTDRWEAVSIDLAKV